MTIRYLPLCFIVASLAVADSFTTPPDGDTPATYKFGQTINVTWSTSVNRVSLVLADNLDPDMGAVLVNSTIERTFTWIIGENDGVNDKVLAATTSFVFRIHDLSGQVADGNGWNSSELRSRVFKIVNDGSNSSSPSSRPQSTISSSILPPVHAGNQSSDTITKQLPNSSRSDDTQKTLIAVLVVVSLMISIAFIWFLKRFLPCLQFWDDKSKNETSHETAEKATIEYGQAIEYIPAYVFQLPELEHPSQMAGSCPVEKLLIEHIVEMPA